MAKIITVGTGTPTQRDYVNGFEYYTDFEEVFNRLEHFTMDEGRMRPTTPGGTTYRYEFDMKDHLGNTRMTLTDANNNGVFDNYTAEVLQADDYYPFGMRITRKLSASDNKYTYNGKEHENEFGLNWYHYGARYYDPAIGRWWAVDPADEYQSGYVYVGNKPLVAVDPDGKVTYFIHGTRLFGGTPEDAWPDETLRRGWMDSFKDPASRKEGMILPDWGGALSDDARMTAGIKLAGDILKYNLDHPDEPINIVAHSHGGNVAIIACNILQSWGIQVNNLVVLGTPVLPDVVLNEGAASNPVSFFNSNDEVQVVGSILEGGTGSRVRTDMFNVIADDGTKAKGAIGSHTSMTESS